MASEADLASVPQVHLRDRLLFFLPVPESRPLPLVLLLAPALHPPRHRRVLNATGSWDSVSVVLHLRLLVRHLPRLPHHPAPQVPPHRLAMVCLVWGSVVPPSHRRLPRQVNRVRQ